MNALEGIRDALREQTAQQKLSHAHMVQRDESSAKYFRERDERYDAERKAAPPPEPDPTIPALLLLRVLRLCELMEQKFGVGQGE